MVNVPCSQTPYGCCSDQVSPARGPGFLGCPNITQDAFECARTTHGCCLDGETISTGDNFNDCEEEGTFIYSCTYSPHGCCPDEETPASGPNNAGCPHKVLAGGKHGFSRSSKLLLYMFNCLMLFISSFYAWFKNVLLKLYVKLPQCNLSGSMAFLCTSCIHCHVVSLINDPVL